MFTQNFSARMLISCFALIYPLQFFFLFFILLLLLTSLIISGLALEFPDAVSR